MRKSVLYSYNELLQNDCFEILALTYFTITLVECGVQLQLRLLYKFNILQQQRFRDLHTKKQEAYILKLRTFK